MNPAAPATRDEREPQDPAGWNLQKDGDEWNRAHLIAREFGGSSRAENIVPTTVFANQTLMRSVENEIERRLNAGERVYYQSVPVYNPDPALPVGVHMYVASSVSPSFSRLIPSGVYR
ncbi:DNA/RNA non-specific endonuclease [Streptomyces sp. NPDC050743]|uniref:DNA/RNA non-specific endonuclease n=1 Tax=Streptomyces sp. NPDC050743 TaxID=3365634 RepID=UPI0037A53327